VPVAIGLAFLVALLQTAWHRNDKPEYKRLTRFFGTLLLINVAVGVVTGLVQEFEFGMNWSAYSRFVGDDRASNRRPRLRRSDNSAGRVSPVDTANGRSSPSRGRR
jgi:hypothetical protein